MRTLLLCTMFMLGGCDTLGEIVREKKYSFDVYSTETARHGIGYNDDYDYVGYVVDGKFGKVSSKHIHNPFCIHQYREE